MLILHPAGPGAAAPTFTSTHAFEAQQWTADANAGVGYSFLTAAGAANVQPALKANLRVSATGRFAVEDADLTRRQPRHFFADQAALEGRRDRHGRERLLDVRELLQVRG
jgi:hypothetical protein